MCSGYTGELHRLSLALIEPGEGETQSKWSHEYKRIRNRAWGGQGLGLEGDGQGASCGWTTPGGC